MAQIFPLKLLSNAQTANVSGADQGGGVSFRYEYPGATIAAGTTVTQMPFFVVPPSMTNAKVTNFFLMTGGTAPSAGTMTVTVKKNGSTSIFTTSPTVTTTATTNTVVNAKSAATTGYVLPVMLAPNVTLVPGDILTYDITGGATVTLQAFRVEVQDMSGITG